MGKPQKEAVLYGSVTLLGTAFGLFLAYQQGRMSTLEAPVDVTPSDDSTVEDTDAPNGPTE